MSQDAPTTFFRSARACFEDAVKQVGGTTTRTYVIAGHVICLQFAGDSFVPSLTPALEHLRIEPAAEPALQICIWDSTTTHSNMVPSPWTKDAFAQHGIIPDYNTDRICTIFQPGENTLNMLDKKENSALYWRKNTHNIPYYTVGAPFRSLFHWWMHHNNRQLLHAAAVGTPEGGVLIVGKGGSGKSTTALSCLQSDLVYAGDDYTLLSLDPEPYVHSLYSTAKLNVGHIDRLPFLVPYIYNKEPSEEDKYVLLLNQHCPEKVSKGFPIKAILIPTVTGKPDTRFRISTPMQALTALAPSTIFQMAGNRTESFDNIARLVKKVPAYVLECGTDIPQIPCVIGNLLKHLS